MSKTPQRVRHARVGRVRPRLGKGIVMSEFAGFSAEGLDLLARLPTRNKLWFDENRKTYQALVLEPLKAFTSALGELLREQISPRIEVQPKTNGSISPINNDLRFNPTASPYKDHLMVNFWEGAPKKTAPTLRVRFSAAHCGYASGAMFDPKSLDRWRSLVDSAQTGAVLAAAIDDTRTAHPDVDVAGEGLKRVPKRLTLRPTRRSCSGCSTMNSSPPVLRKRER
jgi:uncharacterized protein (DUF2461 family)